MQAVQFLARAVAFDTGKTGIDHIADARHRQRGFRHVGGQHDATLAARVEHLVLVLHRQPRIQRQHFGFAVLAALQRLMCIADLALAREEHQDVAARIEPGDLVHRRHHRFIDGALAIAILALTAGLAFQRAIAHFHREGAAFHADHRRIVEMLGKARGIDGGRGDDQLQIGALAQQLLEIAEQEIDVEAAFVRLVDDDRVVIGQPAVAADFRQQDAVGHELDAGVVTDAIGEAHLVTDHRAQLGFQLLRHPRRHRTCGNPSRLGAADHAGHAAAGGQAQLGQLGGFARAGFTGDHDHLVVADQGGDALGFTRNRQRVVQSDRRQVPRPRFTPLHRCLQGLLERGSHGSIVGFGAHAREHPEQATAIAAHGPIDGELLRVQGGSRRFVDSAHQSNRLKL
ncbi:hypothetical protein D3C81_776180 [compost metagenome]